MGTRCDAVEPLGQLDVRLVGGDRKADVGKPVELIIGEGFNHFEMQETIGNPYGIAGRAALKLMNLTMTLR